MLALQDTGPFGCTVRDGVRYNARLVRTAIAPPRAEFQLLPQPRGAISDLKPVLLGDGPLKPGYIKVWAVCLPTILSFLYTEKMDTCSKSCYAKGC